MIDIEIKTIPHKEQRYDTVGDWYEKDGKTILTISDCGDRRYEFMVAIHELIEKALCESSGITSAMVDAFDFSFTKEGEPGDDPKSPYAKQHLYATSVEKMLCAAMGIPWMVYDEFLSNLDKETSNHA